MMMPEYTDMKGMNGLKCKANGNDAKHYDELRHLNSSNGATATPSVLESSLDDDVRGRHGDGLIEMGEEVVDVVDWKQEVDVAYRVEEAPTFFVCLFLGFQHYISMFVGTLTIPILLAPAICMTVGERDELVEDNVGKSEITGTIFVASGVITLMQTIFGVRLPIVQGGTFALLVPTLAYLNLPKWKCPNNILPIGSLPSNHSYYTSSVNTSSLYIEAGSEEHREIWMIRLREIQGAIMCASLFEILLGASGVIGIMLRFIGPLSICPTVTLLGLALFRPAADLAAKQWWICILTIGLMALFSQYLSRVNIPCGFKSTNRICRQQSFPLFRMFPVILSVVLSWILCLTLTETGVFPNNSTQWGYYARTDRRMDAIYSSPWFRVPYPGQWGLPTVSLSAVCAILSGVLATTVESVGDYHACAKLAGAPPPPVHAINRGILVEGLGSLIDGMLGTGNGTTSTSINVGVVGITKVGSRRVVQFSAVFMIAFGIFTKFGALFIMIPDPIIAGTFFVLFGMIVAVGISSLQNVDLNSSRNLFIIGISIFTGLALPQWAISNPTAIKTGSETIDNVFTVLFSTSMVVGGAVGFFLDNSIPGTLEERGLARQRTTQSAFGRVSTVSPYLAERLSATYDLPFLMDFLRRRPVFSLIPFSPTFRAPPHFKASTNGIAPNGDVQPVKLNQTDL